MSNYQFNRISRVQEQRIENAKLVLFVIFILFVVGYVGHDDYQYETEQYDPITNLSFYGD